MAAIVPVYIEMRELSEALGWTQDRTREWCRKAKVDIQRGRRIYTTLDRLRESVPEAAEEIERRLAAIWARRSERRA